MFYPNQTQFSKKLKLKTGAAKTYQCLATAAPGHLDLMAREPCFILTLQFGPLIFSLSFFLFGPETFLSDVPHDLFGVLDRRERKKEIKKERGTDGGTNKSGNFFIKRIAFLQKINGSSQ